MVKLKNFLFQDKIHILMLQLYCDLLYIHKKA